MTIRKKYPKEFKLDAISLVLEQDGQVFRGNGKLTAEQLEIRRLQEENKRLKMEKEILKKAAVCVPQAHQ